MVRLLSNKSGNNYSMKIVVASDSFKGSLTSSQVAQAVEQAVGQLVPDCQVVGLSIADGGEGLVEALTEATSADYYWPIVSDPLQRPVAAKYARVGTTAFIEMAAASGLTLLKPSEYNPALTSTYGTGELILHALQHGCRQFVIGLGGSATNDAGVGMLQALGYRFYNAGGEVITHCSGGALAEIARIDDAMVPVELGQAEFIVASDVNIPFVGSQGAVQVFAHQKGADDEMVALLDAGMAAFAQVIARTTGVDVKEIAGAGAAGGLGAALYAFLGAEMRSGIDVVLDIIGFDEKISDADLVITGEGKLDYQTATGKAPAGVLARAKKQDIPVVAIAGCVEICKELEQMGFAGIYATAPAGQSLDIAMQPDVAIENIKHTMSRVLEAFRMK
jgi:glycerate kinase